MKILDVLGLISSIVSIASVFIVLLGVRKVKQAKNEVFLKLRIMKNSEFLCLNRSITTQLKHIASAKKFR